jgi:para-nitrobenzyl esterase
MKCLSTIILFLVVHISVAQTLYLDRIFSEINKTTYSFKTYNNETLQFDYYTSQSQKGAPLLVYVHGGGFSGGARDSEDNVDFVTKIAQRGYAVAAVSYRLTMKEIGFGCDVNASKKMAAFDAASYDVSQAIKYILDNDNEFLIDKNKVVLAGSSAGAETVLNMAYAYESNSLPASFKYAGVIGMAGALTSLDNINSTTAIPTQLFHGTDDKLVPYDMAPHHYCDSLDTGYLVLYGSKAISRKLEELGKSYFLYTVSEGSHDWAELPKTESLEEIIDFLYHDVVSGSKVRKTLRTIHN